MSTKPDSMLLPPKENWGSRFGVILAVAGSAVGLGNFLRFPGTAVTYGGGAFMIPYIVSFLLVGVPIVWCEWTMGRLGGRYGQNNGPGIMFAIWRKAPAKGIGAITLLVPIAVYMYYVLLEALCLHYSIAYFSGALGDMFSQAVEGTAAGSEAERTAIVAASKSYAEDRFGMNANGAMFSTGNMLWIVLICFVVNFVIIYRGVTRGIETFCKYAMPMLVICAMIILVRVLTLPNISSGLGFMWNPDWGKLLDPEVWMRAAGQIFFSLSVGFGLILCYSSYLRSNDDVVLTSLSAASANEFCEVVLGGLIVVPTAFLFLGVGETPASTFQVGFFTVPAIMHYMPGGLFFGGMWFGLLFLAAVTSSLSMLQPAIAFLEDGFGLKRRASVMILAMVTTVGASLVMYFSVDAQALDFTDFYCEFMMIVAALAQVLVFGWVIGAKRGVRETNRGGDFALPRFMPVIIQYVTPCFLIVILLLWCGYNGPDRLRSMSPDYKEIEAAVNLQFPDEFADDALLEKVTALRDVSVADRPEWLASPSEEAVEARTKARMLANIARFSAVGIGTLLLLTIAVADIACRNRIGKTIAEAEARGVRLEG